MALQQLYIGLIVLRAVISNGIDNFYGTVRRVLTIQNTNKAVARFGKAILLLRGSRVKKVLTNILVGK